MNDGLWRKRASRHGPPVTDEGPVPSEPDVPVDDSGIAKAYEKTATGSDHDVRRRDGRGPPGQCFFFVLSLKVTV